MVMKTTIFLVIQKRMNSAKNLESKVHLYIGWLDLEHRSAKEYRSFRKSSKSCVVLDVFEFKRISSPLTFRKLR